jgi:phage tail-like protein
VSSGRPPRYWLADQLPRPLAEDPFLRRFSCIFEDVADSVRDPVLSFEHFLDVDTAPPELLPWLAGWLGLRIGPSLDERRQREVIRSAGALLQWRGTRRGLQGLVESLVGGPVEVLDAGGVFREGQNPDSDPRITIRLEKYGGVGEQELRTFVEGELPAGVEVELVVGLERATVSADDEAPSGREWPGDEVESEGPTESPS